MSQLAIDYEKENRKAAARAAYHYSARGYNAVMHHWSYRPEHYVDLIGPLDKRQHGRAHTSMYYDPNFMMFRSIFTDELLDTKEKHLKHIKPYISGQKVVSVKITGKEWSRPDDFAKLMRQLRKEANSARQSLNAYLLTLVETHPDRASSAKR